jgi:hypothetical protein
VAPPHTPFRGRARAPRPPRQHDRVVEHASEARTHLEHDRERILGERGVVARDLALPLAVPTLRLLLLLLNRGHAV